MMQARGSRALVTPPSQPVLTLAECKAALGIVGADQDNMLDAALQAVISQLDPASGGWLGRALRPQTWELRLPCFFDHGCHHPHYCREAIALPFPPLIAIISIKYDDPAGIERTIAGSDYKVLGLGARGKQAVVPLPATSWPATRRDAEAVRIRFTSGYAPAVAEIDDTPAVPDQMPAAIKHAIVLGARLLLSNVERNLYLIADKVDGVSEQKFAVTDAANRLIEQCSAGLLSTYRVYG